MRSLTLVFFLFFSYSSLAQKPVLTYSRCAVSLIGSDISAVARQGIDVTHGKYVPGKAFISDLSHLEIRRLQDAGLDVSILIPDVQQFYVAQNSEDRSLLACQRDIYDYDIPENFTLGSMGGYYTYQEMLDILDQMSVMYPLLITVKQQAGTTLTQEGNQIFWIKISDNPDMHEPDEPEVLYTALHHAREPISLSQMIYYMWYLLERYETDPEVKYLIDHTQMYFIPCVNPDGYILNAQTNPDGGGMWRKNMTDNDGDGTFDPVVDGVDLNRNYGFMWGNDNEGSSPNPGSNTFRGALPFSEPETRAIRDFCNAHNFRIAINYHSYGNYLIYPWGFSSELTQDSVLYNNFAEALIRDNNHLDGTGTETVGYIVNGDATDWMYGDDTEKQAYFTFTSEIGHAEDGFWPAADQILPLCQSVLLQNLTMAEILLNFAVTKEVSGVFVDDQVSELLFDIKRYGLEGAGHFELTVTPVSANIEEVDITREVNLDLFESQTVPITYILKPDINHGEEIIFELALNNGSYSKHSTIRKVYGAEDIPFIEQGSSVEAWNAEDGWGTTTEAFVSAPSSITDSPDGVYGKNLFSVIALEEPVDLSLAEHASLAFWAKWDIEDFFDYVLVQGSSDGVQYVNLCGKYSDVGSIFQLQGEPLYDSQQPDWVFEEIDLSDFLGDLVYLRFVLVTEGFNELDGFYFDDLEVRIFNQTTTSILSLDADDLQFQTHPNPANAYLNVRFALPDTPFDHAEFRLTNILGETVRTVPVNAQSAQWITLEVQDLVSGLYLGSIVIDGKIVRSVKQMIH